MSTFVRVGMALTAPCAWVDKAAAAFATVNASNHDKFKAKLAAKADHTDAMIALGATLMSGDGVEVNYRRGAEWFQKAADLGNAEAMYELATFHIEGDGVEEDPEKVKHWMFKAAALGQSDAIEWVSENFPDLPGWLQDLKKST